MTITQEQIEKALQALEDNVIEDSSFWMVMSGASAKYHMGDSYAHLDDNTLYHFIYEDSGIRVEPVPFLEGE